MNREEKLCRYRHLRAINKRQQSDALDYVSQTAMLDCARRLGLARGRTLMLDNPDEMTLVYDLAVHAGVGGRSRAIGRYADRVRPPLGSDDALMLAAALDARFGLWAVEGRHETVGLHINHMMGGEQAWLIDEALEASCPNDRIFAGRLMTVGDFVMTCGVVVPVDEIVVMEACGSMPRWFVTSEADIVQDPRFAIAIFRAVIRTGTMEGVRYIDPAKVDLLEAMQAG